MKKLIPLLILLIAVSCQKVELEEQEGRNVQEEQTDSASVTPTFDTNGWEGSIDVGFEFG